MGQIDEKLIKDSQNDMINQSNTHSIQIVNHYQQLLIHLV